MGKVDDNKKQKKDTLLQSAFNLFTGKGFAKTTVSDIVKEAGLAKGTFYLYFKDKYDLRDKLIAFKAGQLFDEAHKELDKADIHDFDSEILFVTDYIVGCFQKQQPLLRFLAKNLSWGVFQETLNTTGSPVTEILCPLYRVAGSLSCRLSLSGSDAVYDDRADRFHQLQLYPAQSAGVHGRISAVSACIACKDPGSIYQPAVI